MYKWNFPITFRLLPTQYIISTEYSLQNFLIIYLKMESKIRTSENRCWSEKLIRIQLKLVMRFFFLRSFVHFISFLSKLKQSDKCYQSLQVCTEYSEEDARSIDYNGRLCCDFRLKSMHTSIHFSFIKWFRSLRWVSGGHVSPNARTSNMTFTFHYWTESLRFKAHSISLLSLLLALFFFLISFSPQKGRKKNYSNCE